MTSIHTSTHINAIIQKYLPKDLRNEAIKYNIETKFIKEMPYIIELILRSKSLDSQKEKQNRFNLLPIMNEQQIRKLKNILEKEKKDLEKIEKKHKSKQIPSKPYSPESRKKILQQEVSIKEKEREEADKLLENI